MKFSGRLFALLEYVSPPARVVWIEINLKKTTRKSRASVATREGGVD